MIESMPNFGSFVQNKSNLNKVMNYKFKVFKIINFQIINK